MVSAVTVLALLTGCGQDSPDTSSDAMESTEATGPSPFLYVWAGDMAEDDGGSDFLAVVDADPDSPSYGEVVSSAPVGSTQRTSISGIARPEVLAMVSGSSS